MKAALTLTAMSLALAAPAFAGGLEDPVVEPVAVPAPPPAPLAGAWDGLYGGVQLGYGDFETSDDTDYDDEGAFGGVFLGYQASTASGWVYGVEGDINATDIELGGEDFQSLSHIKARLGYDLGKSLIYATAGAAYADVDGLGEDVGLVGGIGYDYRLTDSVSLGAEALYHSFDDFDDSGSDLDGTTLAARVTYHF